MCRASQHNPLCSHPKLHDIHTKLLWHSVALHSPVTCSQSQFGFCYIAPAFTHTAVPLMQCASLEVQLTSSAEEISHLRAQVAMLEAELADHESSPGTTDSTDSAAHVAQLSSLRAEMQLREQEISQLHLQLQAALSASAEVCVLTPQALMVKF